MIYDMYMCVICGINKIIDSNQDICDECQKKRKEEEVIDAQDRG